MDCSKPIYCCHLWDDFMKSIWSPVLPSQNVCCHWKMTFSNFPVLQNLVGNKVPTKLRVSPSNWHGHSLPPTDISSSNLSSTPTVHKIYSIGIIKMTSYFINHKSFCRGGYYCNCFSIEIKNSSFSFTTHVNTVVCLSLKTILHVANQEMKGKTTHL